MSGLRQGDFPVALDDLGTGHRTLALLADLVVKFMKWDREFVWLTRIRLVRRMLVETLVRFAVQIGAESSFDVEVFLLRGVPVVYGLGKRGGGAASLPHPQLI